MAKRNQLDIPWLLIAGMRHRLVQDYGEEDPGVAHRAAKEHLPALLQDVRRILADHGEDV